MRTWGRVYDNGGSSGPYRWVEVATDPTTGSDDYVWLTTLIQCLKLFAGESPFYANYGIAAGRSVLQQVQPDFDVAKTQSQFASRFASLIVSKVPLPTPTYNVNVVLNNGTKHVLQVAV